ncbi:MAG TPA: TorF family putative porin [Thermoanaerobaculia bacterium]|nr:TorF family putative porin [Thermoanaerobaculia bacterium]
MPEVSRSAVVRHPAPPAGRRRAWPLVALLVWVPPPAAVATAQEPAITVDYDVALASAYVWRGVTFTDGAVFQPSITASHASGFSLNVWGNLDVDDVNGLAGDFQEVDVTLSYGFGGDTVSVEVGLIDYLFPNAVGPETHEVYLSVGFDVALQPSVAVYYDFDVIEGAYATVGIEHGAGLGGGWSWSVALLAGLASEEFAAFVAGGADGGPFNGNVTFTVSRDLGRGSFGAFVAYSDSLDDDVLPDQAVDLYGGVSFAWSF